jgi:hypothetical protein
VQSPATQLVGFNVSSGTAPQQSSCNKLQQAATPKGLLSAALGATHLPEVSCTVPHWEAVACRHWHAYCCAQYGVHGFHARRGLRCLTSSTARQQPCLKRIVVLALAASLRWHRGAVPGASWLLP